MNVEETDRGFQIVKFNDRNGLACSLQQSSIIGPYEDADDRPGSSAVWFGCYESNRAHLSREQVAELVPLLQHWLATGHFKMPERGDCVSHGGSQKAPDV